MPTAARPVVGAPRSTSWLMRQNTVASRWLIIKGPDSTSMCRWLCQFKPRRGLALAAPSSGGSTLLRSSAPSQMTCTTFITSDTQARPTKPMSRGGRITSAPSATLPTAVAVEVAAGYSISSNALNTALMASAMFAKKSAAAKMAIARISAVVSWRNTTR
ncbi:MAG: hypothetical protein BWY52_03320 [Chloroflexi bacterium ADurb.Bin325]|nr:MAG: hypothetical protein BWY52_03320 [Chloroflexi bacterium ADurb.Bin325]